MGTTASCGRGSLYDKKIQCYFRGLNKFPLIRLSELYFIAIESGSAEQAQKSCGTSTGFQGIGQKGPSN